MSTNQIILALLTLAFIIWVTPIIFSAYKSAQKENRINKSGLSDEKKQKARRVLNGKSNGRTKEENDAKLLEKIFGNKNK